MARDYLNDRDYLRSVLDAFPHMVMVVTHDLTVVDVNRHARQLLGPEPGLVLRHLCGEVLLCLNALKGETRCGATPKCAECIIRLSVAEVVAGSPLARRMGEMLLQVPNGTKAVWLSV
jgi:PAS domain-containing protein